MALHSGTYIPEEEGSGCGVLILIVLTMLGMCASIDNTNSPTEDTWSPPADPPECPVWTAPVPEPQTLPTPAEPFDC